MRNRHEVRQSVLQRPAVSRQAQFLEQIGSLPLAWNPRRGLRRFVTIPVAQDFEAFAFGVKVRRAISRIENQAEPAVVQSRQSQQFLAAGGIPHARGVVDTGSDDALAIG